MCILRNEQQVSQSASKHTHPDEDLLNIVAELVVPVPVVDVRNAHLHVNKTALNFRVLGWAKREHGKADRQAAASPADATDTQRTRNPTTLPKATPRGRSELKVMW